MKRFIINLINSIIEFFKDKESRLGFYFIIKFCIAISLCGIIVSYQPLLAILLAILVIDLPFSILEWFSEPSKSTKEFNQKLQELNKKIQECNKRLDNLLK